MALQATHLNDQFIALLIKLHLVIGEEGQSKVKLVILRHFLEVKRNSAEEPLARIPTLVERVAKGFQPSPAPQLEKAVPAISARVRRSRQSFRSNAFA